jgi:MtN3 and saliva related transmembrane protein
MDADIVGFMATIITTISTIPQVIKVISGKSAKCISWLFIFFIFVGCGLWLIYGIIENSLYFIINNLIIITSWFIISVYKYKYDR